MQFRRARFLSSDSMVLHGASGVWVWANITSLAFEYSTHNSRDLMSIGLSFQRLVGSAERFWKRRSCSSSLTENQYFSRMIPERTSIRPNSGQARRNSWYSPSVQNPMTRSTPARLYQTAIEEDHLPGGGKM